MQLGFANRDPAFPDDFRSNSNPWIWNYFPGIPGIFISLKYKLFDVIYELYDVNYELFGYNL